MPTLEGNARLTRLDAARIIDTIARLERRITARFPGSGLSDVCGELHHLAVGTQATVARLHEPNWWLRGLAATGMLGIGAIIAGLVAVAWRGMAEARGLMELLQGSESAVNEVLLLAAAVYFLYSLEQRQKRHQALAALHQIRSVMHIVDMHQLTKAPAVAVDGGASVAATSASPQHTLTVAEMERYLDYCSEMFSLTSKVAALYAQSLNDPVVLEAVSDIETLAASLSNKVWQKIVVLESSHVPMG